MANDFSALNHMIAGAESVLLVCHVSPDGDTTGSALALLYSLKSRDKRVIISCQDPISEVMRCLPGSDLFAKAAPCDLGIAIDCADVSRLGDCADAFFACKTTAVIDHHPTNGGFADINIIDPAAAATGVILTEVLSENALNLNTATCLYAAIISDTGNFSFANTNGRALRAAAKCLDYGVDVSALTMSLFRSRTLAKTKLLGLALSRIEMRDDVAILRVTEADMRSCGANDADAEGIVQYGAEIKGARVTIFAREQSDKTKLSLRSRIIDVSKICATFGGGGHKNAAGCTIDVSIDEAVEKIYLSTLRAYTPA